MLKILCVDDDVDMRSLIALDLRVTGFAEVVEARDGWDAIEKAQLVWPDLILMDIMMPNMNGIEAIRRLRAMHITAETPIIVVSAKDNYELMEYALSVGANEFVTKPFAIDDLKRRIQTYFERTTSIDQREKQRQREVAKAAANAAYAKKMELAYQLTLWQNHPELAANLEQLTKVAGGIIHDLRNRLGILSNYNTRVDYCLWLLESLAFLCFKPTLSREFSQGNWGQSKILAKDLLKFGLEEKIDLILTRVGYTGKKTSATGIPVKGLMDSQLLLRSLWLLFHNLTAHFSETEVDETIHTIAIEDKQLCDPQLGLFIIISICSKAGTTLQEHGKIGFKHVLLGDEVALSLFLLGKAVFLHNGRMWVRENGEIEIKIEDRLRFSQAAADMDQLNQKIAKLSGGYDGPEPNIYPLVRGIIQIMSRELDSINMNVRQGPNGMLDDKAQEIIGRNCRYAQLLLQNLLWLGVGIELPEEAVDVSRALRSVQKILRSEIRASGDEEPDEAIEVKLEIQPNLPIVLGNWVSLQQIFMNLITNALEAMPDGGTLTLRVFQAGVEVYAEISDTGHGIPGEDIDQIFDLAFSTKQGRERGTGLHIVKSIVEKWGGKIEVISKLGKGTTFRIYLQAVNTVSHLRGKEYHAITPSRLNC